MWKRRSVELDEEVYDRWLCAGRPQPISWFLGLSPAEQEILAQRGDAWHQEFALAIGQAVCGQVPTDGDLDSSSLDAEQSRLKRQVYDIAASILGEGKARDHRPPSMARLGARRAKQEEPTKGRGLFGEEAG